MPLHLEPLEISDELHRYQSVLIVSCPVCPPVSLAGDAGAPFMEFFKHGIKTPAYEAYLARIREAFERGGIKTGVFRCHPGHATGRDHECQLEIYVSIDR